MNGGCRISQRETGWAQQSKERERELTRQFPEVWVEDNPFRLTKQQVPLVIELKPYTITSALALGLPDLAKPLTLRD